MVLELQGETPTCWKKRPRRLERKLVICGSPPPLNPCDGLPPSDFLPPNDYLPEVQLRLPPSEHSPDVQLRLPSEGQAHVSVWSPDRLAQRSVSPLPCSPSPSMQLQARSYDFECTPPSDASNGTYLCVAPWPHRRLPRLTSSSHAGVPSPGETSASPSRAISASNTKAASASMPAIPTGQVMEDCAAWTEIRPVMEMPSDPPSWIERRWQRKKRWRLIDAVSTVAPTVFLGPLPPEA